MHLMYAEITPFKKRQNADMLKEMNKRRNLKGLEGMQSEPPQGEHEDIFFSFSAFQISPLIGKMIINLPVMHLKIRPTIGDDLVILPGTDRKITFLMVAVTQLGSVYI